MPTLLQVDSSPLATSISRELTQEFVRNWSLAHPDGEVIRRDLAANPPKPIDTLWVGAAYTPSEQQTPEHRAALAKSDELIGELERADEYVFGVPMHNFGIPSVLKLWIDLVVRAGRTFSYGENGPRGLLSGKKATVLTASGGVYTPGTGAAAMNHVDPYLKTILGFVGVTNATFINVPGVAQVSSGKVDRQEFLKPTFERVRSAVA
ncbi:MAG TPA: NAD(P)H-dependent oxidoreductase [Acidobacteriaceae bacterium]|jgi:FMN-dependent NADH-azoreductase|nr:NAD(P)H-dependent oxidoreductase [Acidobacteriaceae bacterium]